MTLDFFYADGFPDDFSIVSVFRTSGRSRGELFTVYSADGNLVLSVKIARRIVLIYKVITFEVENFVSSLFRGSAAVMRSIKKNLMREKFEHTHYY